MQIGSILGSHKARQAMAAVVALGVVQVPLISFADAPAPWVQKADQKKKKKKKAARRAARRPVQRVETVTRAPEVPVEVVQAPPPVEPAPPPAVVEAPPPVPTPVTPPPAPIPAAAATGGGFNWLFPVLGLVGLGGVVAAAAGSDSPG